jgi:hypothetical protein
MGALAYRRTVDRTLTSAAPLPLEDGLFALPGEVPTWIWAQTCAIADCACRSAFIVATPLGREALLDRARLVQQAWYAGSGYVDVAARLEGVDAFHIDIDSAEAFPPKSDTPLDLDAHPKVRAIIERLDGEILDGIGRLWHRAKGRPSPEPPAHVTEPTPIKISGWQPGQLVAYDEALGTVRLDIYGLDGRLYEVVDFYCVAPGCTCGEITLDVTTVMPRGGPHLGRIVLGPSGATRLEPLGGERHRLEQVWSAFARRHPTYANRLARRDAEMRAIAARIVPDAPSTTARAMPKIGRNDPCPCGSDKKHKKCCGAA